jgi:hypothetical protein
MKACDRVDEYIHITTSAIVGGDWSVSRLGDFTPEKRAIGADWITVSVHRAP